MWKNTRNLLESEYRVNNDRSKNMLAPGNRHNMCIFYVLNVKEHQKCSLKTRAVRNSCSKGNSDRSKNVLAETDMIYVYILRSKCRRTTEMLSQNACGSQ